MNTGVLNTSDGNQIVVANHVNGVFTRDTALATGSQAVTGIGFKPRMILFVGCQDGSVGHMFWGRDDGINPKSWIDQTSNPGGYAHSGTKSLFSEESAGATYDGFITSLDADGFTISWLRSNAPTGILTMDFTAFK